MSPIRAWRKSWTSGWILLGGFAASSASGQVLPPSNMNPPAMRQPTRTPIVPLAIQDPRLRQAQETPLQPPPQSPSPDALPNPNAGSNALPNPGGNATLPGLGSGAGAAAPSAGAAESARSSGTPSAPTSLGTDTAPRQDVQQAGATSTSVSGGGGVAGASLNASTATDLLTNSAAAVGVETQRRNAIVSDTRIRGLRSGQYLSMGDGGLFYPARPDLDTPISKFDPGSIRDVIIIKGPYSSLYGPGFSYIDIATLDSPRYKGYQVHGRSSGSYQTNGDRMDALQSVSVGDSNWGFRATYNYQHGNDYRSGNGTIVPSSYMSNNVNFALGMDLSDKSSIEFKGLRTRQSDLEFPGLYFDISQMDSEAYSGRYILRDQGLFDKFTLDVWYNSTAASGNTRQGAKQAFVQQLLAQSFNPTLLTQTAQQRVTPISQLIGNPNVPLFTDNSNTRFANRSIGYRAAFAWGPQNDPLFIAGTDLNVLGQGLVESISLNQVQGNSLATGLPVQPGAIPNFTQTQRVPESNMVDPGLFFQFHVPVTNRFKVRSGGRLDFVQVSSNPRTITGNIDLFGPSPALGTPPPSRFSLDPIVYSQNPSNTDLSRNYTLLAGYVQTEYALDENWKVLGAFGHAQRPPSLTELYAAGPFIGVLQQGTSRLIGDPNLDPERLTQFDMGLQADYDFLHFGVNAFYAWIQNYITYDVNRSSTGLTQVVYSNTDLATLAGTELFLQADVTSWLTPFGTISYVQGIDRTARDHRRASNLASSRRDNPLTLERKGETEPLPQIPPLESRVGFRIHAPTQTPRWQLELSARMVSSQNSVASSLGEFRTPGFTIFNARGYLQVSEQLLVSAGVENIGDRNYREHLDPIAGNLLGTGALYRPGTNFFFNTQLTY